MHIGQFIDRAIAVVAPVMAQRRAAARVRFEALSAYAAAERTRENDDWRPRNLSADSAILGDYDVLLARSRSQMRDSWITKSIIGAFSRNVVGRGIRPSASAKDEKGQEMRDFNRKLDRLFVKWANNRRHCDREQKQTFWQKQRMAVKEFKGVGEHFIVLSYEPNPECVGLRLQSVEPEQLDIVRIRNEETGNEIRRGIEVDDFGAPVAYWFYKRPLNDYFGFQPQGITGSLFWDSERIPADRVIHLWEQDRTRQTHGTTCMTASSRKVRNVETFDDATILAAKLQASVGIMINLDDPLPSGPFSGGTLPARSDGSGGTPDNVSKDGGRQYNFEPAMVFTGKPGETVTAMPPTQPGNNYQSFMQQNLHAAAAGADLGYPVVARDFSSGTYSAQRQALLEDRRGYGIDQDVVEHELCTTTRDLFVAFAFIEDAIDGRYGLGVTLEEFTADRDRYIECEWVPDGWQWISPKDEAMAASIKLDKRLDTRKRIIASDGGNWRDVFQQLADEDDEADRVGITLPDVEPVAPAAAGDAPAPDDPAPSAPPAKTNGHAIAGRMN